MSEDLQALIERISGWRADEDHDEDETEDLLCEVHDLLLRAGTESERDQLEEQLETQRDQLEQARADQRLDDARGNIWQAEAEKLRQQLAQVTQERDIARAAIRWALGEEGEFAPRVERAGAVIIRRGPFWWRKELRTRAG